MRRNRPVGRPSVWHRPIVDFVDKHGSARALEIRQALGIPKRSFYDAVASLVADNQLFWTARKSGNYRLLKTRKSYQTGLVYLTQLGY